MKNFNKYLLPGPAEKNWGFYVTSAGYTKIDSDQPYPLNHQHPDSHRFNWDSGRILNDFYLVFISMGEGIFESALSTSKKVKEGTCFLLFPSIWHRYKPKRERGWEEYWIGFNGPYPEMLMANFDPKYPLINIGRNDRFLQLLHLLLDQIRQGIPGYHQAITGLTLQLMAIIKTASQDQQSSVHPTMKLIEAIKFLLREAIAGNESTEQVLACLPAGYSKLRRDFKAFTGMSPHQYLLELRLDKVKILLAGTGLDMNEIAYQTGFESASYLSKLFKKKNGIGPREWRKQQEVLCH
ncbi:MAG: AraC family transcriptional regulator [Pedobacter sp.]|nr:AraC family transcriptional regulator [Pedobacter sp.]MDQ8054343.1 AraC family transcriptional regulator [Pedobacter sp.]